MSSISQSTSSTTPHSLDSPTDCSSVQASAYAQALLTGVNVNPAAFKDALQRCQIALDKKSEEVEILQAELSKLKVSMMSDGNWSAKTSTRKRDIVGTSLEPFKEKMTKDIQQPRLLSNPFPSAPDRYRSDDNLDFYNTYVLYTYLHVDYHGLLEGQGLIRSEIQRIISSERSTVVKNVRNAAKDIFFGFPSVVAQAVYVKEYARAREPECLRFLVPPRQVPSHEIHPEDPLPTLKYPDLPPILFPGLHRTRVDEIFRSDVLIQIARCILFGERAPGRAIARQHGQLEGSVISSNCLARQRNITVATPGLIAAAAIVACFVVSGDTAFSESGSVTGAAYKTRYYKFKLLLEESQEANDPHTVTTFAIWNQQLFGVKEGHGEHFEFGDLDDEAEDELSSHRRAIMLQSQATSASTQANPPQPFTSNHLVSFARSDSTPQSPPTSTSGSQSTGQPAMRSRSVIPPPHPPLTAPLVSSEQPDTPPIMASPSPSVGSGFRGPLLAPHLSIIVQSSALIPASQPGSRMFLNIDEDEGVDTELDSDVTPPASKTPISRSPTLTLSATSQPPSANNHAIVNLPAAQLNHVDEQPMAPGSNVPSLPTRPRNPRRGRPPNRGCQVTQPGPGSSTHEMVQQDLGPGTVAAPQTRSLRSRANMGKH